MTNSKALMNKIRWHSSIVSVSFLMTGGVLAADLPAGGVVKSGSAQISQTKDILRIHQTTDKAVIDWEKFDVVKGKSVEFYQPSAQSQILNRVLGSTPSTIAGQIKANGQVFIVNPNGILITKSGVVDTSAFSASTLDISNKDFMKGKLSFKKQSGVSGAVVTNRGQITVGDGGFVALLGGAVDNSGVVTAHLAKVGFGAGEKIVLSIGGSEFLRVEIPTSDLSIMKDIDGKNLSAMISVGKDGKVVADGGLVKLSVGTVKTALRQVVNIDGLIHAKSASSKAGKIIIGGANVSVDGTIDASSDVAGVKGGDVSIASDSYRQTGLIDASGKATGSSGGIVSVTSNSSISLFTKSKVLVDGKADGGIARIIAGAGRLIAQGMISASGENGRGGLIDISTNGGNVVVMDGTKILATGKNDGGLIRIGGEFAGKNPSQAYSKELLTGFRDRWIAVFGDELLSLPASVKTSLGYGTLVDASSTDGDGGTVILWSDGVTQQFGNIKANGFNKGGWVEISGKDTLKSYKLASVEVSGSSAGTILLDPKNLIIERMTMIGYVNAMFKYNLEGRLNSGDHFGSSVSLVGNDKDGYALAVGATGDDDGQKKGVGTVYLFKIASSKGDLKVTLADKLSRYHRGSNLHTQSNIDDHFGSSVSLVGNAADGYVLAVGAKADKDGGNNAGAVYLFKIASFNGANQTTFSDKLSGKHEGALLKGALQVGDNFGSAVSLAGNAADGYVLAVGAMLDDDGAENVGAVYLFKIKNFDAPNQTSFVDKLSKSHAKAGLDNPLMFGDYFGSSVSLVANGTGGYNLVVGAYGSNDGSVYDTGAVYLFKITSFNGANQTKLVDKIVKINSGTTGVNAVLKFGDNFGSSVSLVADGNGGYVLAVGAMLDDDGAENVGAVYLFKIKNFDAPNQTSFVDKLSKSHAKAGLDTAINAGDNFGSSVGLVADGDGGYVLAVGARGSDNSGASDLGEVHLFKIASFGDVNQTTLLKSIGENFSGLSSLSTMLNSRDQFGRSVSLIGNETDGYVLAVGASEDDSGGAEGSGAVYLFSITSFKGVGTTTFVDKLSKGHSGSALSSKLKVADNFGIAVSLVADASGGYMLAVGARGDDDSAESAGAVYLFKITSITEANKTKFADKLDGSHSGFSLNAGDRFGRSLSLVVNKDGGYLLAVGAYMSDAQTGSVYLFKIASFDDVGKTTFADRLSKGSSGLKDALEAGDLFGTSVSLVADGNGGYKLAVGAKGDGDGGRARGAVYLLSIANFESKNQTRIVDKLSSKHTGSGLGGKLSDWHQFGYALSLIGNDTDGYKLAVGAVGDGSYAGSVYLFKIANLTKGNEITLADKLSRTHTGSRLDTELQDGDVFGSSLSLMGNATDGYKLAVGAYTLRAETGEVYLFSIASFDKANQTDIVRHLSNTKNIVYFYETALAPRDLKANIIVAASNDITVNMNIEVDSDPTKSGSLTMIAGRSLIINGNIKINGKLKLVANANKDHYTSQRSDDEYGKNSEKKHMKPSDRDGGVAKITVATGKELMSSNADVAILVQNGSADNADINRQSGQITLWKVSGKRVSIRHMGSIFDATNVTSKSQVALLSGGFIKSTKDDETVAGKTHIEIKADSFINDAGIDAFQLASVVSGKAKGRYLVWTKNPHSNSMGEIVNYDFAMLNKKYDKAENDAEFSMNSEVLDDAGNDKTGSAFLYSDAAGIGFKTTGGIKTKVYDKKSNADKTDKVISLTGTVSGVAISNNMKFKISVDDYDTDTTGEKHKRFRLYEREGTLTSRFEDKDGKESSQVSTASQISTTGFSHKIKDGNNKRVFIAGTGTFKAIEKGATISKKVITFDFDDIDFDDAVYDRTTDVTGGTAKIGKDGITGVLGGDDVTVTWTKELFKREDKNAGSSKKILVRKDITSDILAGGDVGNYQVATMVAGTDTKQRVKIAKKIITLDFDEIEFGDFGYNKTAVIDIILTKIGKDGFDKVEEGDDVTANLPVDQFERKDKTSITISVKNDIGADIMGGADAGNYEFSTVPAGTDTGQKLITVPLISIGGIATKVSPSGTSSGIGAIVAGLAVFLTPSFAASNVAKCKSNVKCKNGIKKNLKMAKIKK